MTQEDDRGGVWQIGISVRLFRVVIKRKYEGDGIVEVLGLIKQSLAVKSGDIFVEIGREEVEWFLAEFDSVRVILQSLVKVDRSLRGETSDLLIATSVPRNEENRDPFDLVNSLASVAPLPEQSGESSLLDPRPLPPRGRGKESTCLQSVYVLY